MEMELPGWQRTDQFILLLQQHRSHYSCGLHDKLEQTSEASRSSASSSASHYHSLCVSVLLPARLPLRCLQAACAQAFQLKLPHYTPKLRWKTSNPLHSYRTSTLLLPLLLLRSPPFSGDRGILFDARNGCRVKSCRGSRWQGRWNLGAGVYMRVFVYVQVCMSVCVFIDEEPARANVSTTAGL